MTAQMMRLDTDTGRLQFLRSRRGGSWGCPDGVRTAQPQVSTVALEPGDRVLCFTDGLIEEHESGQDQFREEQLIGWVNPAGAG
ncbi:SpoIIE family protein phosphatase [Streptomyces sp. A1136]|uniref:SpoIIE family protein phosphatase n=1 Tax=Streptomyces sp. A1136 TaxID=2563102 RepID=UPI001F0FE4C2|nr:SpoIIE family protein phosphatase [Streptomyces sp. A1136]